MHVRGTPRSLASYSRISGEIPSLPQLFLRLSPLSISNNSFSLTVFNLNINFEPCTFSVRFKKGSLFGFFFIPAARFSPFPLKMTGVFSQFQRIFNHRQSFTAQLASAKVRLTPAHSVVETQEETGFKYAFRLMKRTRVTLYLKVGHSFFFFF